MDAGSTTHPPLCDVFWSEAVASHMKAESILMLFDAFCEHPRHSAAETVCRLALLPYEVAGQRRLLLDKNKSEGEAISVVLPFFPTCCAYNRPWSHSPWCAILTHGFTYIWIVFQTVTWIAWGDNNCNLPGTEPEMETVKSMLNFLFFVFWFSHVGRSETVHFLNQGWGSFVNI